jgi:nucleotide-binding universal stress UspA family protein
VIKTVLVPITGGEGASAAFAAAERIGRLFAAHVDFLHVRTDPVEIAVGISADVAEPVVVGELAEELEKAAAQREEQAFAQFQEFCRTRSLPVSDTPARSAEISVQWHREVGREAAWVAEYGRSHDLLIVIRQGSGDVHETLEAALIESGRPILVPASETMPAAFETIAVAWKSTPQTARAMTAAMPFLTTARRVLILSVAEEARDEVESAQRLAVGLQWHGVETESRLLHSSPEGTAATLLAACAREHADLLVMGGYGHSRLRELVFGGVTASVLRDSAVPLLLVH